MSTPTGPIPGPPPYATIEAAIADDAARADRRRKGGYVIADFLALAARSLVIAWMLDVLRPATGMGWLPHLTWWQVSLVLCVLGMTVGSLTGDILVNYRAWRDVYARPRKPEPVTHVTHTYVNGVDVTKASTQVEWPGFRR